MIIVKSRLEISLINWSSISTILFPHLLSSNLDISFLAVMTSRVLMYWSLDKS